MNSLIQRLLVARTTGHAPPDLIDAVLEQLPIGKPAADCRAMRDSFLKEVARRLTGSTWQRAQTLSGLIQRFPHPTDDIRRLLWQAAKTGVPRSAPVQLWDAFTEYAPLLESPRELTPAEIEAAGRAWYSLVAGEQ